MDRAHRIGQKKEVQVFRFCVENSIEEKARARRPARRPPALRSRGRAIWAASRTCASGCWRWSAACCPCTQGARGWACALALSGWPERC